MHRSDFQLERQRLVKTDFQLNQNFEIPKNFSIELSGNTAIKHLSETSAEVLFAFSIYKDKPLDVVPFKCDVLSEGIFSWNQSVSKEQLDNYLNINAPSILLSYIRSIISMITSYAGLPNVMIPLINFYKSSMEPREDSSGE